MTLRAVRQCPVDPTPVVEELGRPGRAPLPLRRRGRPHDERAGRLDDAAPAARRVPARRGARARGGGARGRQGRDRARQHRRRSARASGCTAEVIVGADGANGITARAVGLGDGIAYGVAYEGNVRYPTLPRERYARRLVLELADIPGGYAWVFPKGDHANVGVGGWQSEGPKLSEHLRRACEAHGLDPDEPREPARAPAAAPAPGHADRGRACAARRRRGRADRPGLGRRDVRVLRLVAARGRARSSTCSRAAPRRSRPTRPRSTASSRRSTARRGS